jgi:hypothetical protein
VTETDFIPFVQCYIGSVYTLELLLLLKRKSHRVWRAEELVRELRSSRTAVAEALARLAQAGLVCESAPGCFAFAPASADHERRVREIERAYASAPMSVVRALVTAPGDTRE